MEIDPRRLLVLRAIARAGGVSAAAKALHLTPSAVSQQLARLESEAGLPLVDRTHGRLELTTAGRALAERGEAIEQELAGASRDLVALGAPVGGPVAIGGYPSVLAGLVVPAIRLLARHAPAVTPTVVETGKDAGLRELRLGHLDLLLTYDDRETAGPPPPGVAASVLAEDLYRIVLPAAWPDTTLVELAARPWIVGPPDSARGVAFARFAHQHQLVPVRTQVAMSQLAVQALLDAELGVALLPSAAEASLRGVRACAVEVPGSALVRVLHRTSRTGPPPAAQAMVTALHEAVRDRVARS